MGQDANFREEHVQVEHCDGKLGGAHGLEFFFEGERSILVSRLETKTVAGDLLTLFDKIRFKGFDVSGRGEVERLFGFQIPQGEDLRSIADEGRFEFVFDEALASPSEGVVVTGEGGR